MSRPCNHYRSLAHHHPDREPCHEGFTHSVLALKYNAKANYCTFSFIHIREVANAQKLCFGDAFQSNASVHTRSQLCSCKSSENIQRFFTLFFDPSSIVRLTSSSNSSIFDLFLARRYPRPRGRRTDRRTQRCRERGCSLFVDVS